MEGAPGGLLKQGNAEAFHRKAKNSTEYLTTLSNQKVVRLISKVNFLLKISALILQLIFYKWYKITFRLY